MATLSAKEQSLVNAIINSLTADLNSIVSLYVMLLFGRVRTISALWMSEDFPLGDRLLGTLKDAMRTW